MDPGLSSIQNTEEHNTLRWSWLSSSAPRDSFPRENIVKTPSALSTVLYCVLVNKASLFESSWIWPCSLRGNPAPYIKVKAAPETMFMGITCRKHAVTRAPNWTMDWWEPTERSCKTMGTIGKTVKRPKSSYKIRLAQMHLGSTFIISYVCLFFVVLLGRVFFITYNAQLLFI